MLDQNTDRMWFVIGALVVGAGIILLANKTMPDIFASVAETFENNASEVSKTIREADDNLLVDSNRGRTIAGDGWLIATYELDDKTLKDGETVTLVVKGHMAEGRRSMSFYNTYLGSDIIGFKKEDFDKNGIARRTFNWRIFEGKDHNETLGVYMPSPTIDQPEPGSTNGVEWVKLVRGEYATNRWTP